MSIYNVNLFATDAAKISLTKDELENSYGKLQERLRLHHTIKNIKSSTFSVGIRWGIPVLVALFAAAFFIPSAQEKSEYPLITPIENVRSANFILNTGVIVNGNIQNRNLSSLLADVRDFSTGDMTYTGEPLPYLPEIDVFKPNFPDHGIHLLNFSNTLIQPIPQSIPSQFIPAELQFPAGTGSGM
jgi:hypothetical protein